MPEQVAEIADAKVHHTSGPWVAELDTSRIGRRWSITAPTPKPDRRFTVAVAVGHNPDEAAITDADARLIAAAPDLLAACKMALEWFQGSGGPREAACRDAIAKATRGA